jgi:CRP-like cAMP-binding protein
MLQDFLRHIHSIYPVSVSLQEDLLQLTEVIEVPRKTHIIREGQTADFVWMVLQGLMRSYYLKDGTEICSSFMQEQHLVVSVNSFYNRKPGYEFIETLEDSVLARIHYDSLQRLYREHLEFNYIVRVLTERYTLLSEERLFLLRKQTAEDRYKHLLEHDNELLQRVPLKYIASYLGMNLETLSRIRKKISK